MKIHFGQLFLCCSITVVPGSLSLWKCTICLFGSHYNFNIARCVMHCLCRLLNGNKLSGSLPDELGYLWKLNRFQVDQNQLSGPIPKSFGNLVGVKHM